jgi:uncharacterized protein (DUF1786 family)
MGLLLIDIGRGTQDILLTQPGQPWENSLQLVLPSPTAILAGEVSHSTTRGEDIFFSGETMGGGPLTKAVRRHLEEGLKVWATPRAAATFDDDLDKVQAMGVTVVGEEEVPSRDPRRSFRAIRTGDVDLDALAAALGKLGLPLNCTAVAVAVQDHGRSPRGTSDRRFRFENLRARLARDCHLPGLAYTDEDIPDYLTRMQGVRRSLEGRGPLLFMDTGFAALLGALADPVVGEGGGRKLLLNAGNGHTLAGLVEGEELVALFEHHTGRLDGERLEAWLDRLVRGEIAEDEVYRDGGHGAYLRRESSFPGWEGIDVFAATGPRRALADRLEHRPYLAAPHGQMMLTGNCGLYRAWRERWGTDE